jgi:hypothetical protein
LLVRTGFLFLRPQPHITSDDPKVGETKVLEAMLLARLALCFAQHALLP